MQFKEDNRISFLDNMIEDKNGNIVASYEGNKPYLASWSSPIDEFQQYKIQLAVNLIASYEAVKTEEAKATEAVTELLKVQENDTVLKFAKLLEKKLN